MNLNEAYELYTQNPEVYADPFGVELIRFAKSFQKKQVRDAAGETSVSALYSTDDAIGEAICHIWGMLPNYKPDLGTFSTWAGTIIKNKLVDYFRRNKRRNEIGLSEGMAAYEPHRNIDDKLTLKQLISKLSKEDQRFVKMKLERYTDEEVAQSFNKNIQWVWNKWHRLKNKMKEMAS